MTPEQFMAARKYVDLTQHEMALALRLDGSRTIRKYESGERPIPGPVRVVVAYILRNGLLPETVDLIIADRAQKAKRAKPVSRRRLRT